MLLAAYDREALLDARGALELMQRAVAADPEFLPAVLDYEGSTAYLQDLRRAYLHETQRASSPFGRCIALVLAAPNGYPAAAVPELLNLEARGDGSTCSAGYLGHLSRDAAPGRVWLSRAAGYLERALAEAPMAWALWLRRAAVLKESGRRGEVLPTMLQGIQHARHAYQRVWLYRNLVGALVGTPDSGRVAELSRALAAAVERDGRPGIRYLYPEYVRFNGSGATTQPAWERMGRERIRLAEAAGSPLHLWATHRNLGVSLSDAGRPAEALGHLDQAVRIADSIGSSVMRLDIVRFRGRAYAKLGRFTEAEQDLKRAIALEVAREEPYLLAETYHNLAHVYEGSGRMAEAARAADQFIQLTESMQHAQPRMMSWHDAGVIRLKAGWPAAANAAFEQMVRVTDEQERGFYWAGEYYERIGDLPRALSYFQRGAELEPVERSLNLGGAARVFRALGRLDSAEAAARAHDQAMTNQIDVPLLPPILAAAGRTAEAVEISRAWARKQVAQGNVQGAALATVRLADLLLASGNAGDALTEAHTADSLARRVNLRDELIQALRIQGSARLRQGDRGGLAVLREAVALARAHPSTENTLLTELALAEALARSGSPAEALGSYDRAATAVERVAAHIEQDFDRSRFREHQLAPFDGALDLLLAQPDSPARLSGLLLWSERRKAASLALAAGFASAPAARRAPALLGLAEVRRRLPEGSALVDYLTVRGRGAALVVTTRGATLIPLPLPPDSLGVLAERLRRPLTQAYAGRVDLSRAAFDLDIARALYAALLAPLESLLGDRDHLFVVPDGPLHYVPFDALVASPPDESSPGSYAAAAYALDRYTLELLPSAQFLPAGEASPPRLSAPSLTVLVIQRDAPGGTEEVARIRAAWPLHSVTVLEGAAATESAAREAAPRHAVLHFATHASADDREPLSSHLRLAGDERHDGFLHLGEIASQRNLARLVLLSACETLSGRLYHGEGLMGLARAFLASGAETVIATQWPVGPSTAQLMGEFHREFAATRDPASALRHARLDLRNHPETAHPFFWAGFVLVRGASEARFPPVAQLGVPAARR